MHETTTGTAPVYPTPAADRRAAFIDLDQLRISREMTQRTWARTSGLSENIIARYRMGDRIPSDVALVKLRRALGLPALAEVTTAN